MNVILSPKQATDVLIVGAGPAGLGCAVALKHAGLGRVLVVDRDQIGGSFQKWPVGMRLLTPSFYGNPFGAHDLNAITPETSPADFLKTQHPTGRAYAMYLRAVARHEEIDVLTGVAVRSLTRRDEGFEVDCGSMTVRCGHVIWAAGEFCHPDFGGVKGHEHGIHNSRVRDWSRLEGVEHAVIGGFESGMDAAIHLARAGKTVHVFSRGEPWAQDDLDPSQALVPRTRDRLREVLEQVPGRIQCHGHFDVEEVRRVEDCYRLCSRSGASFDVSTPPVFCTGFDASRSVAARHFLNEAGEWTFTEEADESFDMPGLHYSGPALRHRGTLFCFLYKFRARFAVIARHLARQHGLEAEAGLAPWIRANWMLEDLSCCQDCQCGISGGGDSDGGEEEREDEPAMSRISHAV